MQNEIVSTWLEAYKAYAAKQGRLTETQNALAAQRINPLRVLFLSGEKKRLRHEQIHQLGAQLPRDLSALHLSHALLAHQTPYLLRSLFGADAKAQTTLKAFLVAAHSPRTVWFYKHRKEIADLHEQTETLTIAFESAQTLDSSSLIGKLMRLERHEGLGNLFQKTASLLQTKATQNELIQAKHAFGTIEAAWTNPLRQSEPQPHEIAKHLREGPLVCFGKLNGKAQEMARNVDTLKNDLCALISGKSLPEGIPLGAVQEVIAHAPLGHYRHVQLEGGPCLHAAKTATACVPTLR